MAAENWEDGGSQEHRSPPTSAAWYVADDDTQLGPISVAEVEERCLAGELGASAMVWSSGMSDWLPMAEVPELAHLVPESAQPGRLTDDESWTPISAAELATLAAAVESRQPVARDGVEVKPAGYGEPVAWSVPVVPPPPPPARSRRAPFAYAAGIGGAAVIGAFIALFFAREVAPPASGVSEAADRMRPQSDESARGSGGHALPPVVDETAGGPHEAKAETKAGAKAGAEVAANAEPAAPERRRPRELCQSVACSGHGRCLVRAGKARCSCEAGFRNAGPTRCVAEPAVLDKDAITAVVAERNSELRPCLARARKPATVAAGRYAIVVSWMIRADGSVGQVRWRRPDWARSTTLPECFAGVIRTWSFPAPGRDFAVNNFPLGHVTLK